MSSVTATDSAGTRSFKRLDKLTIPCKDEQKECKTVETEGGILIGVCYCKNTQTALLLPAVQKVRAAAARLEASRQREARAEEKRAAKAEKGRAADAARAADEAKAATEAAATKPPPTEAERKAARDARYAARKSRK